MSPSIRAQENTTQENTTQEKVTPSTEDKKTTLISLYSWATILPKELIDLQNTITKDNTLKPIEELLPKLSTEIDALRWETTIAQSNPELHPLHVTNLHARSQRIDSRLHKITIPINSLISHLSDSRKQWMKKQKEVLGIDNPEDIQLILGAEQYEKLQETIEKSLLLIENHLKLVLELGKKIGELQIILYSIDSDLANLDSELKETSTQQTAPSMLSAEFYSRINYKILFQGIIPTKRFITSRLESLKANSHYFFFGILAFMLACFAIIKTRDISQPQPKWQPFAKRPIATTIFMGSSINAITNIFPINKDLPEQWESLLHVLTLFAIMRLTKHLVNNKDKRKLLNILSFFMGITMFVFLLNLPHGLVLLYVFIVSIVAFLYYLFSLPFTKRKEDSDGWLQRLWGVIPAIVLFACVTGYDQLAVFLFSASLSTIIACLIVWMLYLFHLGFIELILSTLPFAIIKESSADILKSVQPILAWLHILVLITIQCVLWDIYPTTNKAFIEIINFGFDLGGAHLSLKFIVTVGLVFYGAMLISRAIQTLLLNNVLPRYKAEKGVQLSITRLVHYAILTIGFLVMLKVLGFQLNQITLLGGALSVGIGFGLQAIVNNFASGLILLFERPVKVGDTIQIGTEWGEVKQLGLRATIIQTFDNAEIVVPNSDLITGQVTNWTLADRRVRIKIPVGVAYGTEVSKVLGILVSCGEANPMVLSTPKPNALFLAFGASSLDFELRVWIPEFLDKLQVLSDLNEDIDNEFTMNDIVIPFPQSDLHLKSVEEAAGDRLHGKYCQQLVQGECRATQ